ncbi:flagellar hook-length control protein FliK [Sphingomonas sp. ABOLD]|uniref:Flagellar hook-length control protein FliK n=1 Tax=Sphingomonas trueperi TaxID=53317 RepID=A0A7X5XYY8_9SPHN|nr:MULTISPECIES: flagellar hook-length control protein FliK [Sphingomonas]NJB97647.1 flagellar hook-length control protein FliK [Sphingomonas trueperi]RSV43538.1 flagellar hook-length control protein FliK [Sphingomonas sp. ABOLE]RSV52853.1 flagellar hook-length control protein FliK [Sphingomonas sp. ABOLD]
MNVTNIGSPFAALVPQEGAANAAAGIGFAGLLGGLGGPTGWGAQGLVFAGGGATGLLGAQTGAPLLPATPDANALPGDKPQVGMTQLLATAAPGTVTPPVATGGNPLADAIAKALADARGKTDDASAEPATPVAAKPTAGEAQPETTDPLAALLEAAAPKPTEYAEPARPAVAEKVAKPGRGVGGDKNGLDPASAPLPAPEAATPVVVQPIAVPVAQQQQPTAQPAAAQQPAAQSKTGAVTGPRYAKADAITGNDAAPAQTTNDKLADAVAARPHGGGGTDGSSAGDHGQQNFGQQLAAADTRHGGTSAVPFPTTSGHVAPAANAAPATPATEPVLNARAGELGRSLGVEIARKVDAGEDMLRVRMNPAELGRVEVTLAFDDKGRVQATMRAESPHTLELLRQEAPDLGRALDQAGIRSDASSFRFESRDGGAGNSGGNGQQASQQQSRGGNQQFHDEPDAQTAAYRPIRGDGQVDLIA